MENNLRSCPSSLLITPKRSSGGGGGGGGGGWGGGREIKYDRTCGFILWSSYPIHIT